MTEFKTELERCNKRTGAPYSVWVTAIDYTPAEPMTRDHPGYHSQIEEYDARTTLGAEIDLTELELATVLEEYEEHLAEQAEDYRI